VSTDDVVAAASRGERWALTELYRAYQPGLVRFLRGQERAAAEDLASEVWIAVAHRLGQFVGDERAFRCWLFTIARNRLADHRRRAARRRTSPLPADDIELHIKAGGSVDPADLVVGDMAAHESIDVLAGELPPAQAEVVLLRVVGGLDVAEVASITGRSEGAVRVLQCRALKRLSSALASSVVTR
jgi:RNA polymerase sigma-70 factor (ECF subfamily)